ncbi:MAG: PEP-CTERM sorting domain-containing protein [Gemmatimonadaceae bacterium]|nr:PEP-CTERM sorting domain-containing protein [Gemmatimonadaceae bacterium]
MQLFKHFALAGALMVGTALSAGAQTQVTDRGQIVGPVNFSWAAHPNGTNPFVVNTGVGDITMTVTGSGVVPPWYSPCQTGQCWSGGFNEGDWILFGYGSNSYDFAFSGMIGGFATQAWYNQFSAGSIRVTAWNGDTQVGQYVVGTSGGWAGNDNQASVVGLTGVNFNRLRLQAIAGGNPEFAINNVTFGSANITLRESPTVVPEPSTYALMAAGLAGMAVAARRRRTVA